MDEYMVREIKGGFFLGNAKPDAMQRVMNRYAGEWEVVDVACYIRTLLIFFRRWSCIITFRRRRTIEVPDSSGMVFEERDGERYLASVDGVPFSKWAQDM